MCEVVYMSYISTVHQKCPLYSSAELAIFRCLQDRDIIQKKDVNDLDLSISNKVTTFASCLLKMFGFRYKEIVQSKLSSSLQQVYLSTCKTFKEIWAKYNLTSFSEGEFSKTNAFMIEYFGAGVSKAKCFSVLRNEVTDIFPFLQVSGTQGSRDTTEYRNREAELLVGFNTLNEALSISPDHKESPQIAPLTPQEQFALVELLCKRDALVIGNHTYSYADLVVTWNEKALDQIKDRVGLPKWEEIGKGEKIPQFQALTFENLSWLAFLAECTLQAIEENLDLQLPRSVRKSWCTLFMRDELIRSDLAFFTGYPQILFEFNEFASWRTTGGILQSIQVFLYFVRRFGVPVDKRPYLLMMILDRRENTKIEDYNNRSWDVAPPSECPKFASAWNCFEICIRSALDLDAPLSDPEAEAELRKPDTFPFFCRLIKSDMRTLWAEFFENLATEGHIQIPIAVMDQFCQENGHLSVRDLGFFSQKCVEVIQLVRETGKDWNLLAIFLSPPFNLSKLSPETAFKFGQSNVITQRFLAKITAYQQIKKQAASLLRYLILHPENLVIFDLFEEASSRLEIEITQEETLYRIFTYSKIQIPPDVSLEMRDRALAMTAQLSARYQIQNIRLFFLYLEVLNAVCKKQESLLRAASLTIAQLKSLTPAITETIAYYLFLYPPDPIPQERLQSFLMVRMKWEKEWRQYKQNTEKTAKLNALVLNFVDLVVQACSDPEDLPLFITAVRTALDLAFHPSIQPLTDYLQISDLNALQGPQWKDHRQTHFGCLRKITSLSDLGIYLCWEVRNDFPAVFLTFFDLREKTSHSLCVTLKVSLSSINNKREAFFAFLRAYAAREQDAVSIYTVEKGLAKEVTDEVVSFVNQLEAGFLKCFYERSPAIDPKTTPRELAAQGHIFRSSFLLPDSYLALESDPGFYTVDFHPSVMDGIMSRFSGGSLSPSSVGFQIGVTLDRKTPISVPICVRSIDRDGQGGDQCIVLGFDMPNEGRRVELPLVYPFNALSDPILFKTYFDFHIKQVQASWYRHNLDLSSADLTIDKDLSAEAVTVRPAPSSPRGSILVRSASPRRSNGVPAVAVRTAPMRSASPRSPSSIPPQRTYLINHWGGVSVIEEDHKDDS